MRSALNWRSLWLKTLDLVSVQPCLCCGADCDHAAPRAHSPPQPPGLCDGCLAELALPEGGLQGDDPLLWCAAAAYRGPLRALLLRQRPRPDRALMAALALCLQQCCAGVLPGALLVPIPSWKRSGNPLPALLAAGMVQASAGGAALAPQLLRRSRPTVGQHHLGRELRARNLLGAFVAAPAVASAGRPVWLVDDILTTGATALAAAQALEAGGHAVQGVLTLARTPRSSAGRDLRSTRRFGDGPG